MSTEINAQDLLAEHIRLLTEWGMPQSELEQIVWQWHDDEKKYSFGNSPQAIVEKIRHFEKQQSNPSKIDIIRNMHYRI